MPKKRLSELLEDALTKAATTDEVVALFKQLTQFLKDFKSSIEQKMAQYMDKMDTVYKEHEKEMKDMHKATEKKIMEMKTENQSDARTTIRLIEQKVNDLREEIPEQYNDSNLMSKLEEVRALIPMIPEQFDATEILNQLEKIREDIEELKRRPVGRGGGGGGTSAIAVRQAFKYIAHTEAPVGDIDGVNLTYTVKNDIFWIAGFTLNGEQVAELPNFTYAGKTITFATAIPAIYSGKDFECKYIG